MSENKTREDIISEHSPHGEYNHYYHEHAILEMLTEFSDQEKRSTAIAFARWKDLNYAWLSHQDDRPYYLRSEGHLPFDETTFYSLSALYDLYINSL